MAHGKSVLAGIGLLVASTCFADVMYTFDIATNSPVNPIHFSFTESDFLGTQSGPLPIMPFDVSDTLGDSWTFTNGLINVAVPPLACFGIVAPPAVGESSACGLVTNPPGGGFLFIFGTLGGPIDLPTNPGVFAVETDYVLVSSSNVTFEDTVPTTMTVSSVPEPRTAPVLAGLIALLVLRRTGYCKVPSGISGDCRPLDGKTIA